MLPYRCLRIFDLAVRQILTGLWEGFPHMVFLIDSTLRTEVRVCFHPPESRRDSFTFLAPEGFNVWSGSRKKHCTFTWSASVPRSSAT